MGARVKCQRTICSQVELELVIRSEGCHVIRLGSDYLMVNPWRRDDSSPQTLDVTVYRCTHPKDRSQRTVWTSLHNMKKEFSVFGSSLIQPRVI